MNSKQTLMQPRKSAEAAAQPCGLAMKHRWIAAVLEEMRQANAVIEQCYGRSRAMWRDEAPAVGVGCAG